MKELFSFLNLKPTEFTDQALYEQRVPRKKTTESIKKPLYSDIYKACGGYTMDNSELTETDELNINKKWVENNCTKKEYDLFIGLCSDYEQKYWSP